MARVVEFEGRRIEVPDDATDDEVAEILSSQPAAPAAEAAAPAAPAAAPADDSSWLKSILGVADYADNTGAHMLDQGVGGVAALLGAPVDLVNAGMGLVGLPTSQEPFLGSSFIEDLIGAPADIARAATGAEEVVPQDAF